MRQLSIDSRAFSHGSSAYSRPASQPRRVFQRSQKSAPPLPRSIRHSSSPPALPQIASTRTQSHYHKHFHRTHCHSSPSSAQQSSDRPAPSPPLRPATAKPPPPSAFPAPSYRLPPHLSRSGIHYLHNPSPQSPARQSPRSAVLHPTLTTAIPPAPPPPLSPEPSESDATANSNHSAPLPRAVHAPPAFSRRRNTTATSGSSPGSPALHPSPSHQSPPAASAPGEYSSFHPAPAHTPHASPHSSPSRALPAALPPPDPPPAPALSDSQSSAANTPDFHSGPSPLPTR